MLRPQCTPNESALTIAFPSRHTPPLRGFCVSVRISDCPAIASGPRPHHHLPPAGHAMHLRTLRTLRVFSRHRTLQRWLDSNQHLLVLDTSARSIVLQRRCLSLYTVDCVSHITAHLRFTSTFHSRFTSTSDVCVSQRSGHVSRRATARCHPMPG